MRIEPTHFIKAYSLYGKPMYSRCVFPITSLFASVAVGAYPVALFLIREKTHQEIEKSIYYPKTNQ